MMEVDFKVERIDVVLTSEAFPEMFESDAQRDEFMQALGENVAEAVMDSFPAAVIWVNIRNHEQFQTGEITWDTTELVEITGEEDESQYDRAYAELFQTIDDGTKKTLSEFGFN